MTDISSREGSLPMSSISAFPARAVDYRYSCACSPPGPAMYLETMRLALWQESIGFLRGGDTASSIGEVL
jgi:hypothetical protein